MYLLLKYDISCLAVLSSSQTFVPLDYKKVHHRYNSDAASESKLAELGQTHGLHLMLDRFLAVLVVHVFLKDRYVYNKKEQRHNKPFHFPFGSKEQSEGKT